MIFFLSFTSKSLCFLQTKTYPADKHSRSDAFSFSLHTETCPPQQKCSEEHVKAFFCGLVEGDGDGSILVYPSQKYIKYEIRLEIHKKDSSVLTFLNKELKLDVKIITRKTRPHMVKWAISNKKALLEKIIPLFDFYPMLSEKHLDYLFFRYHLVENQTKYCTNLDKNYKEILRKNFTKKAVNEILNFSYFDSWLVGFIQAEGSFFVSQQKNAKSPVCYFTLTQKVSGQWILEVIKQRLNFHQNVRMEANGVWVLKCGSVTDCQSLLNFLANCPMKLQGTKKTELLSWMTHMRSIPRYVTPRWAKPIIFPPENHFSEFHLYLF